MKTIVFGFLVFNFLWDSFIDYCWCCWNGITFSWSIALVCRCVHWIVKNALKWGIVVVSIVDEQRNERKCWIARWTFSFENSASCLHLPFLFVEGGGGRLSLNWSNKFNWSWSWGENWCCLYFYWSWSSFMVEMDSWSWGYWWQVLSEETIKINKYRNWAREIRSVCI